MFSEYCARQWGTEQQQKKSPFSKIATVPAGLVVWEGGLTQRKQQDLITAINLVILDVTYLLSA